jgi:hypothetical protein
MTGKREREEGRRARREMREDGRERVTTGGGGPGGGDVLFCSRGRIDEPMISCRCAARSHI